MKKVAYHEFFKTALNKKYESTSDVVDSLITYSKLVNYRLSLAPSNPEYWFLVNLFDFVAADNKFYENVYLHDKALTRDQVLAFVTEFDDAFYKEYSKNMSSGDRVTNIMRDTKKLLKIWLKYLR